MRQGVCHSGGGPAEKYAIEQADDVPPHGRWLLGTSLPGSKDETNVGYCVGQPIENPPAPRVRLIAKRPRMPPTHHHLSFTAPDLHEPQTARPVTPRHRNADKRKQGNAQPNTQFLSHLSFSFRQKLALPQKTTTGSMHDRRHYTIFATKEVSDCLTFIWHIV